MSLHIEQRVSILKSEYDLLLQISKRVVALESLVVDLQLKVKKLEQENGLLKEENRLLREENRLLREENLLLKNGKKSNTSHTSPSHDIGKSNKKSLREVSTKKTGGQLGHEGTTLLMSSNPDEIIEHKELNYCQVCAQNIESHTYELLERRQEIILPPILPKYIEHRSYKKTCLQCGHQNCSVLPENLTGNIQYGNCVEGLVAYLHAYQYLPMNRIVDVLTNVFQLPLSEGTVDNLLNKFAQKATNIYTEIQHTIEQSNVIGSDETGSKINGKKGWFHVWQTTTLTYIVASMSRGFSTVEKHFSDGFPLATLVSDCWAGQLKTVAKHHQLCIAHLLRELNNFIDALNDNWSKEVKQVLEQAIKIKNESIKTGLQNQATKIAALKQKLHELLLSSEVNTHKKTIAFVKRLRKHESSILVFLDQEDVPYDNNASERGIRNVKVKTKISGCFRTLLGAERFAVIRSVIDTTIKNSQNIFEVLNLLAKLDPFKTSK